MSCLCPLKLQRSRLFRSYRPRVGQESIDDDSTDNICLVRVSTIVGFLFLVGGLIMVVSSYIKNNSYDMEIALAFIVGTCLVFAIVLGYIFRFWWKMRTRRKETPDEEEDTVGDYFRDIFCLPPNFRGERTEPEGSSEEVDTDIVTSC